MYLMYFRMLSSVFSRSLTCSIDNPLTLHFRTTNCAWATAALPVFLLVNEQVSGPKLRCHSTTVAICTEELFNALQQPAV